MVRCNIGCNLAPKFVTLLRPIDTNDTSPILPRPKAQSGAARDNDQEMILARSWSAMLGPPQPPAPATAEDRRTRLSTTTCAYADPLCETASRSGQFQHEMVRASREIAPKGQSTNLGATGSRKRCA